MASVNNDRLWIGEATGQGPVALIRLVDDPVEIESTTGPIIAAATSPATCDQLTPKRVAAFLEEHADRLLVCHDAAPMYWLLHDCIPEEQLAEDTLRETLCQFPLESRLWGLGLLDQRLHLVKTGQRRAPGSLDELVRKYLDTRLADPPSVQERLQAILAVFEVLRCQVGEVIDHLDPLPPEVERPNVDGPIFCQDEEGRFTLSGQLTSPTNMLNSPQYDAISKLRFEFRSKRRERWLKNVPQFGPLGHWLDVSGAIALCRVKQNGLKIDPEAAADLAQKCMHLYEEGCTALREDRQARGCFHWENELVPCDRKGYPKFKKTALRTWLRRVFDDCLSLGNAPLKPPLDRNGRLSLVPEDWGILPRCHPLLRAWNGLWTAAAAMRFLSGRRDNDDAKPLYRVCPRIRSVNPSLSQLHRLRPGLFIPRSGYRFLVGKLRDLELRCVAVTASHSFPDGPHFPFVGMFGRGGDPVQDSATGLREALERIQHQVNRPFAFLGLPAETQVTVTRVLLRALCRGLSVPQTVRLLHTEVGAWDLGSEEVDRLADRLIFEVCQGMNDYIQDPTDLVVADRLGVLRNEFCRQLYPNDNSVTWAFALRNVLSGKREGQAVWEKIRSWARERPGCERVAEMTGGPEAYDFFMTTNPVSITGRVGPPVYWTERIAAEHVGLADDVMKSVVCELVISGARVVGVTEDEFVVEVLESQADAANQVVKMAETAASRVLGAELARGCCICETARQW